MSTKYTVAHGSDFHLYREVGEDEAIYLELEGVAFEASPERIVIPIPSEIWELIRRYGVADFTFAAMDDAALAAYVDQQVDERIRKYSEEPEERKRRFAGAIPFGMADDPREEQITRGMAYFREKRERQRRVQQRLNELEQLNAGTGLASDGY